MKNINKFVPKNPGVVKVIVGALGVAALASGCSMFDTEERPDVYEEMTKEQVLGLTPVERVALDYHVDGVYDRESEPFDVPLFGPSKSSYYTYTVAPYDREKGCGTALARTNLENSTLEVSVRGLFSNASFYGDLDRVGSTMTQDGVLTILASNGQEVRFVGFDQAEEPVQPYDQKTVDILRAYGCELAPTNPSDPAELPDLAPED